MALSLLVLVAVHPLSTLLRHAAPWSAWHAGTELEVPVAHGSWDVAGRLLQENHNENGNENTNQNRNENSNQNENVNLNEKSRDESYHNSNATRVHDEPRRVYDRRAMFGLALMELMISVLVFLGFSAVYKPRVTDKRPAQPDQLGIPSLPPFKHGLCGCFEDMDQCMHGCCCPYTRAADSLHAVGAWNFWEAFCALVALYVTYELLALISVMFVGNTIFGQLLGGVLFGLVFGRKRGELRRRSGGEADFVSDCVTWWCCACCAIVQEARQVDENQGVRVNCCCQLTLLQPIPVVEATVVGPPVMRGKDAVAVGQPTIAVATVIGTPVQPTAPAMATATAVRVDTKQDA